MRSLIPPRGAILEHFPPQLILPPGAALERELGAGGMTTVKLAQDLQAGRSCYPPRECLDFHSIF